MIQEFIVFMIIGSAVTIAVIKTLKKFRKKKKVLYKNESLTMEHNCSDCPAECMLRNAIQNNPNQDNETYCSNVNVKSD